MRRMRAACPELGGRRQPPDAPRVPPGADAPSEHGGADPPSQPPDPATPREHGGPDWSDDACIPDTACTSCEHERRGAAGCAALECIGQAADAWLVLGGASAIMMIAPPRLPRGVGAGISESYCNYFSLQGSSHHSTTTDDAAILSRSPHTSRIFPFYRYETWGRNDDQTRHATVWSHQESRGS